MRSTLIIAFAFSLALSLDHCASACGGGGGGSQIANRSSNVGGFKTASFMNQSRSLASSLRQQTAAFAAAHHAKMLPIRMANAAKTRNEKLAKRQARADVRIAKLEAKRESEQEFLVNSRTWTDGSGQHKIRAMYVQANDSAVQLKKADGSLLTVKLVQLSSTDRNWVHSKVNPHHTSDAVMLVSLGGE